MDEREVGRYWEENADTWTALARAGYDIYRDLVNTPAFFAMLPGIGGLRVLDIGCGEGHNTRLLAQQGARVVAIDIARRFVSHAREAERERPLGIDYQIASAVDLPFANATFGAATAFMSLMDVPWNERAIAEAFRVLEPGGLFQFSIAHPCFNTPRSQPVFDDTHRKVAVQVGDYFATANGDIDEWTFGAVPVEMRPGVRPFRIPRFTRTLSEWLNLLVDTGFVIERVGEPYASDEAIRAHPRLYRTRVVADSLIVRVRKPSA